MPLMKVIAEGQTQVPVEMERDDNSAWHPPECLEEREARSGGGPLRFLQPKDAKVDKRRDVDYLEWVVTSKKESRHWMEIWWGPSVSGGSPHDDLITSSAKFKGRALIGTKFQLGIDFRGRSSDGTLWRWTGGFGQFVEYRNAPAEIAAYFDKIFDSA